MAAGLWRIDGGRLALRLHAGQRAVWDSDRRFLFVIAGTQGGKTSFGPWWLAREVRRRGPGDYLAVSSTVDLARLKMLPALREYFEWALRAGMWRASERTLCLRDPATGAFGPHGEPWARIVLRSAAADGGLESATAQAAWLDECGQEAFSIETWEAVLRRLSLAQGRVLGTTTPYGMGWLKTEVYDRWRAGDPHFDVVQFASTANPAFPADEMERARAAMPGWRFSLFYRGQFERPGGAVYGMFDAARHVADDHPLDPSWPRVVGVDFGAVNTALVWLAQAPDGLVTAYRESLAGALPTREHVGQALRAAEGEPVTGWWGGAPGEDQQRMDWTEAGILVRRPPVADVEAGIDRVSALLAGGRLRVFRSCAGLIEELGAYRRVLDGQGRPTEAIADRAAFHRLDALRYAVCGLAAGRVRYGPRLV